MVRFTVGTHSLAGRPACTGQLAQLVRALHSHCKCRGFDSPTGYSMAGYVRRGGQDASFTNMVIAHRGFANNAKENTIRAFEEAFNLGADAIECDLRLTLDQRIVVCHNDKIEAFGKTFRASKTLESALHELFGKGNDRLLTIDELFDYIEARNAPFFLDIKKGSSLLIKILVHKIKERNLWPKVHIIGFSFLIRSALKAQLEYPKLRVMRFINVPLYSPIKKPVRSYGVFLGWLDSIGGSRRFFRLLNSSKHLVNVKRYYEKHNMKVMAGVINDTDGFRLFKKVGVSAVVTDNLKEATHYF